MSGEYKRKKIFLVNRDFQLRYALVAVFSGVVTTLFSFSLLLIPLYIFEVIRITRFLPFPVLLLIFLTVLVNIGIIGAAGVFLTHKIAGPMFSLVRSLRAVESGSYGTTLKLRSSDELKFVARNFNEMTKSLRLRTNSDLAIVDLLLLEEIPSQAKERLLELRSALVSRLDVNSNSLPSKKD